MTGFDDGNVLALAAGTMVLTAALIVWRRDLRSILWLLAAQGVALATIPLIRGVWEQDWLLIAIAGVLLVLRAVIMPGLLARALRGEPHALREAQPLVNTASSLLVAAALIVVSFAVTRPLVELGAGPASGAVPAGFAVVLIALFVMAVRRHAISQAAGFLMLDNGITATAFLLTAGVPLIVELGASLDVLFAVIVLGILTGRIQRMFGRTDLDQLQELRD